MVWGILFARANQFVKLRYKTPEKVPRRLSGTGAGAGSSSPKKCRLKKNKKTLKKVLTSKKYYAKMGLSVEKIGSKQNKRKR